MPEWIDATKELPPAEQVGNLTIYPFVLTYEFLGIPEMKVGYYDHSQGHWCNTADRTIYDVSHWMPLPEAPELFRGLEAQSQNLTGRV